MTEIGNKSDSMGIPNLESDGFVRTLGRNWHLESEGFAGPSSEELMSRIEFEIL